mgnify:CR=1 FL=1
MLKKANDSIFLSIKGLEKIKEDADHKIVLLEKEEEKQKENKLPYSLEDILRKFDKEMDSHEKDLINDLLVELKWKR